MFNPLLEDLTQLTLAELDEKISSLSRKYWMTTNPSVQQQIAVTLDQLKQEARIKQAQQNTANNNGEKDDKDLDNLINIS